jgi:hypothetical protein
MTNEIGPETNKSPGISRYDTVASSALRFIIELVAWIVGPWAVASYTGTALTAIPTAVVLIGLSSVFSTSGDKSKVIVATPGPLRLAIELLTAAIAVIGAWSVWPQWTAVIVTTLAAADLVAGIPRARWLARGAPTNER